jgi:hypothetical protein
MSKLRRRTLGAPPPLEEASNNLAAPEHAPAASAASPATIQPVARDLPAQRIDARTLRKTHRTVTFATKVTAEWDADVRAIAQADGIMLVEVLERCLEAYKRERG